MPYIQPYIHHEPLCYWPLNVSYRILWKTYKTINVHTEGGPCKWLLKPFIFHLIRSISIFLHINCFSRISPTRNLKISSQANLQDEHIFHKNGKCWFFFPQTNYWGWLLGAILLHWQFIPIFYHMSSNIKTLLYYLLFSYILHWHPLQHVFFFHFLYKINLLSFFIIANGHIKLIVCIYQ